MSQSDADIEKDEDTWYLHAIWEKDCGCLIRHFRNHYTDGRKNEHSYCLLHKGRRPIKLHRGLLPNLERKREDLDMQINYIRNFTTE